MLRHHLLPCSLIAAITLFASLPAHSIQCSTSKCYLDVYNSVDPESLPVIGRVRDIHRNLVKTIGSQQALRSKLIVINSTGHPWALALSDNAIVLTKGAIESMYRGVTDEIADARIAFVLGHEISHLVTDDLFHHKAFVFNQSEGTTQAILQARPEEELRADLRGYTFASIAGYRTDLLLGGGNGFFESWMQQIAPDTNTKTHPLNDSRVEFIKKGFQNILDHLPYYWFSVALAHFGNYSDAQYLLEDHLNIVETEHAYANLGYIHIQRARELMSDDVAYRYWIPTLLEPKTALQLTRERSLFKNSDISSEAFHHLELAEQMLLKSSSMNQDNLTTHINLAAVYLYMPDKVHKAYAAIEEARRTTLGKLPQVKEQLESIYQLIRIQDTVDGGDRWPRARDTLTAIASSESAPENLLYNLARMLDMRGRDDTSTEYWKRLYKKLDTLPIVYHQQVCFRLNGRCSHTPDKAVWVTEDLPLGKDMRYPDITRYLDENWSTETTPPKHLPGLSAQVFSNSAGDPLLALDHHLEMMIRRDIPAQYRDVSALIADFGEPHVYLPVLDGQLLSFEAGWSAFVKDRVVTELWITKLD